MGRQTEEGESPVLARVVYEREILSRRGPVKSPLKSAAPSAKAKYSKETDSEQVP